MNITKKALCMSTKLLLFAVAAVLVFSAKPAFAGATLTPCPIVTGGNAGVGAGVSSAYKANTSGGTTNGCNVVITFNLDGSIVSTVQNGAASYDGGGDDNLIGIVNNSGHTISSITLSSIIDIFGFENDGACDPTWTFAGGSPCGGGSGYAPSGVTFSGINGLKDSGTVNFAGGIANGKTAWFSLEGPASLNLRVNSTPEPGTLLLLGSGLLGLGLLVRRHA